MSEIPVTVDVPRLRALADRVQVAADALAEFRCPGPCCDGLPGSAIAAITGPTLAGATLSDAIAGMTAWAGAARSCAEALSVADEHGAHRM